jgi:hypothetical protein
MMMQNIQLEWRPAARADHANFAAVRCMFRRLSNTVLVVSVEVLFTLKSDFLV